MEVRIGPDPAETRWIARSARLGHLTLVILLAVGRSARLDSLRARMRSHRVLRNNDLTRVEAWGYPGGCGGGGQ